MSSGLEILAGHPKDLPLGTFRPPGPLLDLNPAFRLPSSIPGYTGLPGLPPVSTPGSATSSSLCRDPYCKDPTCPTAVYNAYIASARLRLPPGYMDLVEAHKMASLGAATSTTPTSISASLGPGGPYICNWMNGREYCGKRYSSAEELLVHLKTHTNLSTSDMPGSALTGAGPAGYAGLLSQSLMRGGVSSPLLPSALSLQVNITGQRASNEVFGNPSLVAT